MGCSHCSAAAATAIAGVEPAQAQAAAAAPPKPVLGGAVGEAEPTRRPSLCCPEAVVGEWRTRLGIYRIALNDRMELHFTEDKLHGVLAPEDEWYIAEIRDGTEADEVFGYLRLRREGDVIRSYFKKQAGDCWEDSGVIVARPLPYLRVGAGAAAEAAAEAEAEGRPRLAAACSICFEAVEDGDDFAELRCRHVYHKSCISSWFLRNGSCPMRCVQPETCN